MFHKVYKKRCGDCEKVSYSLAKTGVWICTGCGEDMTLTPLLPTERSTKHVLPVKFFPFQDECRN